MDISDAMAAQYVAHTAGLILSGLRVRPTTRKEARDAALPLLICTRAAGAEGFAMFANTGLTRRELHDEWARADREAMIVQIMDVVYERLEI